MLQYEKRELRAVGQVQVPGETEEGSQESSGPPALSQ